MSAGKKMANSKWQTTINSCGTYLLLAEQWQRKMLQVEQCKRRKTPLVRTSNVKRIITSIIGNYSWCQHLSNELLMWLKAANYNRKDTFRRNLPHVLFLCGAWHAEYLLSTLILQNPTKSWVLDNFWFLCFKNCIMFGFWITFRICSCNAVPKPPKKLDFGSHFWNSRTIKKVQNPNFSWVLACSCTTSSKKHQIPKFSRVGQLGLSYIYIYT